MIVRTRPIRLDTTGPMELVDLTDRIREFVRDSGLRNGLINALTRHTTSAIRIGEAEAGLFQDSLEFLARLAPPGNGYRHDREPVDGRRNAHAHLAALLLGASEAVPVVDGALQLGSWQRIFFVELDGPREDREVLLTALGEGSA